MMLLKNDPTYRKLKVGGRGLFGRVNYWLANDHVFAVEQTGYTERYKRYRLDEIKAIYASRNAQRLWINLLSGILFAVLGIVPMAASGGNSVPLIWGVIFFALFGFILVVNSVRGPTCTARLITAVQDAPLRGITRLSKAEKLIAEIQAATENQLGTPTSQSAETAHDDPETVDPVESSARNE